jgi:hypothetical protein
MAGDEADLAADLEAIVAPLMPRRLCSSEAPRSRVAAGSSQTKGGPESKASAFKPASTIARSSVGRHVRLDPARLKPARQPEAVAAGFEGNRNPRDLFTGPDRTSRQRCSRPTTAAPVCARQRAPRRMLAGGPNGRIH